MLTGARSYGYTHHKSPKSNSHFTDFMELKCKFSLIVNKEELVFLVLGVALVFVSIQRGLLISL